MIPAHVVLEGNTRSAADSTKRSHRGLHRMLTRCPPCGIVLDAIGRIGAHQVRLHSAKGLSDIHGLGAVAAQQTMPPQNPEVARTSDRVWAPHPGRSVRSRRQCRGMRFPHHRSRSVRFQSQSPAAPQFPTPEAPRPSRHSGRVCCRQIAQAWICALLQPVATITGTSVRPPCELPERARVRQRSCSAR